MFSERSAASSEPATRPGHDLSNALASDFSVAVDREALGRALTSPRADGHARASETLSARLRADGVSVDPASIVLGASAQEIFLQVMLLLCDPGDTVVVPESLVAPLSGLAARAGVHLESYPLLVDTAFRIDGSALFDVVDSRTRLIVGESPGTPTGNYLSADELELLSSFGLPLLIDERRFGFSLEGRPPAQRAAVHSNVLTFVIDSLEACAPGSGLNLAWVSVTGPSSSVVAEAVRRLELARETAQTVGLAMTSALDEILSAHLGVVNEVHERCRQNLDLIRECRAKHEASGWLIPMVEGGHYATLCLPGSSTDVERLLAAHEAVVQSGEDFDLSAPGTWIVLRLTATPDAFRNMLDTLSELTRANR